MQHNVSDAITNVEIEGMPVRAISATKWVQNVSHRKNRLIAELSIHDDTRHMFQTHNLITEFIATLRIKIEKVGVTNDHEKLPARFASAMQAGRGFCGSTYQILSVKSYSFTLTPP